MPQVSYAVKINRPISEVFRFAINFKNAPQWQPDVMESHQSEDSPRVGVMVTQTRSTRLLGWRLDLNADIISYQPNRLIEYKGVLGRFPVRGVLEFQGGGGQTTVTENLDIRMGFLFGIFSPLMRGVMTQRTKRALERLKAVLESRSSQTSGVTDFHSQL